MPSAVLSSPTQTHLLPKLPATRCATRLCHGGAVVQQEREQVVQLQLEGLHPQQGLERAQMELCGGVEEAQHVAGHL